MNRTDRLMGILLEFQARGERRAEDLARRFEVSVRTVYRDVQALSESGVPLVATPGKGYRLIEGYFLPPLSFTAGEAAVLALGGEFVRGRVDPELRQAAEEALRKLAGVLPPERREAVARWQRELLFPSLRERVDPSRLAQVRAAIQARQVVRLLYHAFRREAAEARAVEPVSLVYLADAWHLTGYCRLRQAPRIFRLDRIDAFELLDERFSLGERHVVGPPNEERTAGFPEAHVRFDAALERWVRERQAFLFLREEFDPSGAVFVYALRDEQELLPWLLAWGGGVEVISRAILARHTDPAELSEISQPLSAPAMMLSGALP